MFGFFSGPRRARQAAFSIGQLIHMLSAGRENHGPKSPESLLRGLGTFVDEHMMGTTRVIRVLTPMTTEEDFFVSLMIDQHLVQTLIIEGRSVYAGFTLSCGLPKKTVIIDLQPTARHDATWRARLLYAACKKMGSVAEGQDFR
jgi:hypothetical protein